jgi:D-glycero-D-manno-heptose 1,7-bisphosphate phosphatase
MKAVFFDRDGTITVGTPTYERVDSLEKVELLPNTLEALSLLASMDYSVFFVTNQAGIAEGLITKDQFNAINNKVLQLIAPSGIQVIQTYLCPHGDDSVCECRKPKPKLLFDAAHDHDIDLHKSWMIGDRSSDVMTAVNAGAKGILVKTGAPTVVSEQAAFVAPTLLEAVLYIQSQA